MTTLPIDTIIPELRLQLQMHDTVILSAEPGAGKTTRVPVALMDESWLAGRKILMLEPRRLAAVRSAEFMAERRGERTGSVIGYRIRGENTTTTSTRIDVVTEGILTRMIQDDASLEGIGLLIFDEFHERSIHADLGLALALDVRQHLRGDLKIIIMSATIDADAVAAITERAAVIHSGGRMYPVGVTYLPLGPHERIEASAANAAVKALREQQGDILVFLPGQREIRNAEQALRQKELPSHVTVHSLYGEASAVQQRAALRPAPPGERKIILSTNIAETSLTIDGVRVVVDSGSMRTAVFDPRRGMTGLVTVPVSKASAEQRKGRAGRQAEGHCYRLWTEAQHALLPEYSTPEILAADLAPLAMELAMWGDPDARSLKFLDAPPASHLRQAQELLRFLGAVGQNGTLTPHGTLMGKLPVHPRIAHMLLKANERGSAELACDLAAVLDERDLLRGVPGKDIDLSSRIIQLRRSVSNEDAAVRRGREQAKRLRDMVGLPERKRTNGSEESLSRETGILLALAYPDRIAKRKQGERYQLSGNSIAILPKESGLFREEYLAVADVDGAGNEVRILLAEPLDGEDVRRVFADQMVTKERIAWDDAAGAVTASVVTSLGAVIISERTFVPEPERTIPLVLDTIRRSGLSQLPWSDGTSSLIRRSEWLRSRGLVTEWPALSEGSLLATLEQWLAPYLERVTRTAHLAKLDMHTIITSMFTYQQLQELERKAPTHLRVPTGSMIGIDYSNDPPILAVRLQEMFGESETPSVGGGAVKVLLHLLSPARRPLAVTQDLPSFWKNAYVQVRKDMRGDYPKHYWPEDPLQAEPTRKTKRGMGGIPT